VADSSRWLWVPPLPASPLLQVPPPLRGTAETDPRVCGCSSASRFDTGTGHPSAVWPAIARATSEARSAGADRLIAGAVLPRKARGDRAVPESRRIGEDVGHEADGAMTGRAGEITRGEDRLGTAQAENSWKPQRDRPIFRSLRHHY
jgi:hypothetical protein